MYTPDDGITDAAYLPFLRQKIETHLQWGAGESWRHQDFQELSERILEKTGEQLSNTTLKRIWGKLPYRSLPNTHTLNTLARFTGYENWLAFRSGQHVAPVLPAVPAPGELSHRPTLRFSRTALKYLAAAALLGGLILGGISLISTGGGTTLGPDVLAGIQFSSRPVSEGVPNTVVFNYDVSQVPSDSFQIQQSWDTRRRFPIKKDQFEVTSTYYYPGFWKPKLLIDGQVVREHELYIKSGGWMATTGRGPIPRYIRGDELFTQGYLSVTEKIQREIEAKAEPPESMIFFYIDEFADLHSDNFSLELAFRNTYFGGDGVCQHSRIGVYGTEGHFFIPFSIPGCVGELAMELSELELLGSQLDLSAFGCDFREWQHFRMEVRDRHVQLFLNGKKIHEVSYLEDAGKITGLKIRFLGSGAVDDVRLKNGAGQVIFEDDFGAHQTGPEALLQ